MNDDVPRVSIGLPVYNGERYLADALDSLLAQTFVDFELVISDNASTDSTREICQAYTARDGRIRYLREPENRGAIWNFIRVFELSRGEYFKWAASDDICSPTLLARCVETLDADQGVVWCHSQSAKIDEHGDALTEDPEASDGSPGFVHTRDAGHPRQYHDSQRPSKRLLGVLLGTSWSADSYGLIRAEALRKTRLLLPCYGAEKVLIGELSLLGRYAEVPETLFLQRVHAAAAGSLKSAKDQQSYMAPKLATRFAFTRVRLLSGYVRAVLRTPMSLRERFCCLLAVGRYLLQTGKWHSIIRSALSGAGLRQRKSTPTPNRNVHARTGQQTESEVRRSPDDEAEENQLVTITDDQSNN